MRTRKSLLFGIVALSLALTTVPAAAVQRERDEGFRGGHREERQVPERQNRDRWEHRDRDRRFAFRAHYAAPSCYTQPGYWAWDGWQQVWVAPQTICH